MSERKVGQTRKKWLLDATVFLSGLVAALSGIYFLFVPSGGYQGGRNPMYGVTILFSRHTWADLHTWGGVLMIAAAVLHFAIHWRWVKVMSKTTVKALLSRETKLSKGPRLNVAINVLVAISFLLTTVSGIYFLFAPSGGFQGGRNTGWDPMFLFSRTTWDLIHTWAGVVFISAAVVHFWIHWRWVKTMTKRLFRHSAAQAVTAATA
jgi:membrane protein implicated in regulation of membrane protease activity